MSGEPEKAGVDNLAQLLVDHPLDGTEPLLSTLTTAVTGDEARRRAAAVATELCELGIEPGQAVAVQLPNGPDFVLAMMGVWLAGAVFVPVNDRLPPPSRDHLVVTAGAAALVSSEGLRRLEDGRTYGPEVAFVTWTSGTTGPPKPILHTHRSYVELLDRVLGPLRGKGQGDGRPVSPNLIPVSLALNAGIYNVLFGLRVGADIGGGDVLIGTDEVVDLLDELAGQAFELAPRQLVGVAVDAPLAAPEGEVDHGGLPRHQARQRARLVLVDVGMIAQAPLERSPRVVVLDAVADEVANLPRIHLDRDLHP